MHKSISRLCNESQCTSIYFNELHDVKFNRFKLVDDTDDFIEPDTPLVVSVLSLLLNTRDSKPTQPVKSKSSSNGHALVIACIKLPLVNCGQYDRFNLVKFGHSNCGKRCKHGHLERFRYWRALVLILVWLDIDACIL